MFLYIFVFIIIIYIIALFISDKKIFINTYPVETPLLLKDSIFRIVLISDLHSTIYGKDQSQLINSIKHQNPDLILLSGDIFDDNVVMTGTQLLVSNIFDVAPIYYVTGNHEYRSHKINEIRKELEYYGVTILSDEYVKIEKNGNKLILAGIEDPEKKIYEVKDYDQNKIMEGRFRELDNILVYKILLAHRPERIDYYKKFSFDMVLSGHTHGGQIRIPHVINGLFAPNQGLFPKYGGGIYKYNNMVHIISRGLSIEPLIPRLFNPPELVVIILKSNL